MDSEHRHELKRNDLAQWLADAPEHLKNTPEYLKTHWFESICVVLIVVGLGMWIFRDNQKIVVHDLDSQIKLTKLYQQQQMDKIAAARGNNTAGFLNNADELTSMADTVKRDSIAALALIKAGDALRSDLHYKKDAINENDLKSQIAEAKGKYQAAIAKAGSNKTIEALAKFGVAICAEEIRDFDSAATQYKEIANNPDYQSNFVSKEAANRLILLDDVKVKYKFKYVEPAAKEDKQEVKEDTKEVKPAASEPETK